jgi:hypothetical protein
MLDSVYLEIIAGAVCIDADPELFDPDSRIHQTDTINLYCVRCPVRILCRDFAIENGYAGVWGTTTRQRNRLAMLLGFELA